MTYVVYSESCNGSRRRRTFKTLAGARKHAQDHVGETPELGTGYAVSRDGIATVSADGCKLLDLFPKLVPAPVSAGPVLDDEGFPVDEDRGYVGQWKYDHDKNEWMINQRYMSEVKARILDSDFIPF